MNLQTTNEVIVSILKTLGLNPETVPETEMLAEFFVIRNCLNDECVRVSLDKSETKVPCANIILQTDSTIDGLGDALHLSYANGDNIPAGPRHSLTITNLKTQTLLYRRERHCNPANEWTYNCYAQAQVGFKFQPQGADPRFMTRKSLYEFMRETPVSDATHPTVAEYLKIDASTELLAEVAYLNFWNHNNNNAPVEEGIDFVAELDYANDTAIITISCDHREDIEPITFLYALDPEAEEPHLNHYELLIMDGDNLIYERGFDQHEATEWKRNSMANDPFITDGNGNALFIGNPVQE